MLKQPSWSSTTTSHIYGEEKNNRQQSASSAKQKIIFILTCFIEWMTISYDLRDDEVSFSFSFAAHTIESSNGNAKTVFLGSFLWFSTYCELSESSTIFKKIVWYIKTIYHTIHTRYGIKNKNGLSSTFVPPNKWVTKLVIQSNSSLQLADIANTKE